MLKANLACYTVPVTDFDHHWGVSQSQENTEINYFGRRVYRNDILTDNRIKFREKWFGSSQAAANPAQTSIA